MYTAPRPPRDAFGDSQTYCLLDVEGLTLGAATGTSQEAKEGGPTKTVVIDHSSQMV